MTPLDRYYKYYNLSGVSPELLKNEELFNLYRRPPKEKKSERPKVIAWKENSTQQSDLGEMPIDPKGYHYFLVLVELSRKHVDGEPIKNKDAHVLLYKTDFIYICNVIKTSVYLYTILKCLF